MCLTITASLSRYVEKIARNTFAKTKQPLDCALWYIAMRKKNALWGLFKSVQDQRTSTPFILHVEFNHGIVLSAFALMAPPPPHPLSHHIIIYPRCNQASSSIVNIITIETSITFSFVSIVTKRSRTYTLLNQSSFQKACPHFSATILPKKRTRSRH